MKFNLNRKKQNYPKLFLSTLIFLGSILLIPGKSVISKDYNPVAATDSSRMTVSPGEVRSKEMGLYVMEPIAGLVPNEHLLKGGLLYDVETKKILWQKEMDQTFPIASLTKIMVALLVREDIRDGKTDWETTVKVSREACQMGGSKINLRFGESLTVRDLMKSALIASSNDAAFQLAQFSGGTAQSFVERMNARAISLGMKSTFFSNPTGLPTASRATDNHASPLDLLILSTELLKYADITSIAACKDGEPVKHGEKTSELRNHNRLVCTYKDEVNGLKTGFTNHAGFCIVATTNRKNHKMISIVLGVKTSYARNTIVATMVNEYYAMLGLGKMRTVAEKDEELVQGNGEMER
jgi:D-alanyl-D-alanine carboxypeptidase (penicillin-binding protein 5/6)